MAKELRSGELLNEHEFQASNCRPQEASPLDLACRCDDACYPVRAKIGRFAPFVL